MVVIKEVIWFFANLTNDIHKRVLELIKGLGLEVSDKDLHFWIFGVIGMILYLLVHKTFKLISKWSISAISFIYTFTIVGVLVVLIEIQQKITKQGNMELADIVIGLMGFLAFFTVFVLIRYLVNKKKGKRNTREKPTIGRGDYYDG